MEKVIITRHESTILFLKEMGLVDDNPVVIPHATVDDIEGKHVIGVLPIQLAALAGKITTVGLNTPAEFRGKELTLEQVREFFTGFETFVVTKVC